MRGSLFADSSATSTNKLLRLPTLSVSCGPACNLMSANGTMQVSAVTITNLLIVLPVTKGTEATGMGPAGGGHASVGGVCLCAAAEV